MSEENTQTQADETKTTSSAVEQSQPQTSNSPEEPPAVTAQPVVAYEKQPVEKQYFAQPQAAPVQYVITAPSLKGLKGWLLLATIIFALMGFGYIGGFFALLVNAHTASDIVSVVASPILAVMAFTAVVLIVLQKKIARKMSMVFLVAAALYSVLSGVVNFMIHTYSTQALVSLLSGSIIALIAYGLFVLYFVVSKRVKETLVN